MSRRRLDARLVEELRAAASGKLLVAFDLDGTLAPITAHRSAARLSRRTRALLRRVALRHPTAVLTGRSRADARGRLLGIPLAAVVGNHGLESSAKHRAARAMVRGWLAQLEGVPDLDIERKGESFSLHFRNAPNPGIGRKAALHAVSLLKPRPRVIDGKKLLNVLPDVGVDKGTALVALMRSLGTPAAVYVGDDLTDEDVFALPDSTGIITVRVGKSYKTKAKYWIPEQRDIDALLEVLAALTPSP